MNESESQIQTLYSHTDHKFLVSVLSARSKPPSVRIERWLLYLQLHSPTVQLHHDKMVEEHWLYCIIGYATPHHLLFMSQALLGVAGDVAESVSAVDAPEKQMGQIETTFSP